MEAAAESNHGRRMDDIYRLQRHIYDLTRKYYLLGRDRLIDTMDVPPGGTVLEVGCGTGRNLGLVAKRYPLAHVFGLDISSAMLRTAQSKLGRAGVKERVKLAQGNATAFDPVSLFGRSRFDRIFFSYTLSMIPDWKVALDAGLDALQPDGQLHIVDFGQQRELPRWFGSALRGWLARFDVTPRMELLCHCEAVAQVRGLHCAKESLYGDYAWSVTLCARERV